MTTVLRTHVAILAAGLLLALSLTAGALPASAGGGDADWRQAARLPGFGAVDIVVRPDLEASPPAATLLLEDAAGNLVYRFPPLPGIGSWAYHQTGDLALADIDADGLDDVVVIVELVTGIGPSGADPFPQAAIYLRRGDGFEPATELETTVNEAAYGRWDDMAGLLRVLEEG